ncbi:tetratricopeptide repeat protein, partial [Mesorhizobium sp.]|uniref:tetratricopeptide repeat protein n=1 Tax=Mesorhizobium sp. TaxID=1871066 RepID=UPI00338D55BB
LVSPQKASAQSRAQADDALLKQAYVFQQAKRLDEAQDLCLRVLERTPNHPLALYILGTVYLGYDDEMALRCFARAVGEEPKNPYYHLSLGEAYVKVSEYSPAIK